MIKNTTLGIIGLFAIALAMMFAAPAEAMDRVGVSDASFARQARIRGEGEWYFIDRSGGGFLGIMRSRHASESDARMMVRIGTERSFINRDTEFTYRSSLRLDESLGECSGAKVLLDDETLYLIVCADGRYTHFAMGTDEDDLIEIVQQVQDGYEPEAPAGWREYDA